MEIWKKIEEFPDYEVSNQGRVRRPGSVWNGHKGHIAVGTDRGGGYMVVGLTKGKKHYSRLMHRLVAQAFIPNPNNKPCVNHIDCNPSNNNVDNLEWCTKKENSEWMVKCKRNIRTSEWNRNHHEAVIKYQGKPIIGTNLTTGKEKYYPTLQSTRTDGFNPSDVCSVLKGNRHKCKNTVWRYAMDEEIEKAMQAYERKHK